MPSIGPIFLPAPFCQAGLAGYSDRAMRLVARRRGCCYAVTEALLDTILLNGGQGLQKSIDVNDEDHPIAGQIIGSDSATMRRAAMIVHDAGYDVVDLNFACPVKKIKNKARGGHMLMDLPRAKSILTAVREVVPVLTVSMRRSYDDSAEAQNWFDELIDFIWSIDAAAVRVHGRTVEQKYLGRAHWPFLADLKQRYPDRTILGSGDVFTAEDAVRMLRETGVDLVWIARGAIGNPWIFKNAVTLLAGGEIHPPTIAEQRHALIEHFELAMQLHGESLAGRRMRKMGIKYSRFHPEASEVKQEFIAVHSLRDWSAVVNRWYINDGDGVWTMADAADEVNANACD